MIKNLKNSLVNFVLPIFKMPLEKDIQRECLQWLHLRGILAWRSNQIPVPLKGGGFRRFTGLKGVSDILGMYTQIVEQDGVKSPMGLILAIEVKQPKGKLSPEQTEFLQQVNEGGGIGLCVHSLDELIEGMEEYL